MRGSARQGNHPRCTREARDLLADWQANQGMGLTTAARFLSVIGAAAMACWLVQLGKQMAREEACRCGEHLEQDASPSPVLRTSPVGTRTDARDDRDFGPQAEEGTRRWRAAANRNAVPITMWLTAALAILTLFLVLKTYALAKYEFPLQGGVHSQAAPQSHPSLNVSRGIPRPQRELAVSVRRVPSPVVTYERVASSSSPAAHARKAPIHVEVQAPDTILVAFSP